MCSSEDPDFHSSLSKAENQEAVYRTSWNVLQGTPYFLAEESKAIKSNTF